MIFELRVIQNQGTGNLLEGVQKKNSEDQMNIDDWRAFTSIWDMQISQGRPSWICQINDFPT